MYQEKPGQIMDVLLPVNSHEVGLPNVAAEYFSFLWIKSFQRRYSGQLKL